LLQQQKVEKAIFLPKMLGLIHVILKLWHFLSQKG
jgi:hypothetical protein